MPAHDRRGRSKPAGGVPPRCAETPPLPWRTRDDSGFALEPLPSFFGIGPGGAHDLQRHGAFQPDVARAIDLAHPADPLQRHDFIRAKTSAGLEHGARVYRYRRLPGAPRTWERRSPGSRRCSSSAPSGHESVAKTASSRCPASPRGRPYPRPPLPAGAAGARTAPESGQVQDALCLIRGRGIDASLDVCRGFSSTAHCARKRTTANRRIIRPRNGSEY